MASSPLPVKEVLEKEIEAVHSRRREAGFKEYQGGFESPVPLEKTKDSLVGLALSGGGVRSGAFCLGVIQALYSAGRMRAIDFISTVSGGGYAGALFSAEVARTKSKINWDRRSETVEKSHDEGADESKLANPMDRLRIENNIDGSQPDRVKELSLYGRLMGDFVKLLSRHLAGFLVTLTFLISGIVALAAILAIIMRLPYTRSILPYLAELKFATDLMVPMFPAFLALLLWLLCLAIGRISRMIRQPVPSIVQYSYIILIVTTVLGVLCFFALEDVDLGSWTRQFGMPAELQETMTNVVKWVSALISGLFVTLLLPVLAPRRLLESGKNDQKPTRKLVFNVTGWSIVIGMPLFLYFALVHENISQHTMRRHDVDRLTEAHVVDINHFLTTLNGQWITLEKSNGDWPKKQLVRTVLAAFNKETNKEKVDAFKTAVKKRDTNEGKCGFISSWLQAIATPISNRYLSRVNDVKQYDKMQQEMVDLLTDDVLSNPWLFARPSDSDASNEKILRLLGLKKGETDNEKRQYSLAAAALERLQSSRAHISNSFTDKGLRRPQVNMQNLGTGWFRIYHILRSLAQKPKENKPGVIHIDNWAELCALQDEKNKLGVQAAAQLPKTDAPFVGSSKKLIRNVREDNWLLLHQIYPKHFRPQDTTFAFVVNWADQKKRLQILFWASLLFVITGLLTNLNRTNLHGVYKDQLAITWLPESDIALSELDTCSKGGPLQLIQGTLNRMGSRSDPDLEKKSRFCMSYLFCGTKKIGYRPTDSYQNGKLSVADAMAISGAAVSPINSGAMLARVMLFVTNFRLGQWMLNPAELKHDEYWPSPLVTMSNWLRYPEQRKYLFVSDGGHLENSGLAALLERRCRLMILADASYDADYKFQDILAVVQDARAKYGIQIKAIHPGSLDDHPDAFDRPMDSSYREKKVVSKFDLLRPNESGISQEHFIVMEITYPELDQNDKPLTGIIIYCKSSLTGNEVPELLELASTDCSFPHDRTSDQFLDSDRFEAYLELGRHIGESIDRFACQGGLTKFGVPLGWGGSSTEDIVNSKLPESETICEDSEWKESPFELFLAESVFDNTRVEQAMKQLNDWLDQQDKKYPSKTIDSEEAVAVAQSFSFWAREKGSEIDDVKLRQKFCVGLAELVCNKNEIIRRYPTMHVSCFQILGYLESDKRKPIVRNAIKRLVGDEE